jgi:NAD+ kinase
LKKLAETIARVGLVANPEKDASQELVREAIALIEKSGRTAVLDNDTAKLAESADLIMVFGGDGTMLRVAREIAGSNTPMVGINTGSLGFLTDVQAHQLPLALEQIWAGKTQLETRPLIEAIGPSFTKLALNDFVVTRGALPRLIELDVSVNGEPLTRYRADGLIVCSPTGSTAYSLAAGGAVISPDAEVFAITPICPHTLSNRSVVISLNSTILVKALSQRVETILSADGQPPTPVAPGDEITIRRSRHNIRLLHLAGSSFFDTLRRKLSWRGTSV